MTANPDRTKAGLKESFSLKYPGRDSDLMPYELSRSMTDDLLTFAAGKVFKETPRDLSVYGEKAVFYVAGQMSVENRGSITSLTQDEQKKVDALVKI